MVSLSTRKRIMVVWGTRPEAIKLAPLARALANDSRFEPILVSTGQHREMLWPILEWFNLKPHHTLDVMSPGQPLAFLSGKLLSGLHQLMEKERPDIVVVQGDTTTAFMAALTAYYGYDYYVRSERGDRRTIEIAHIEAGLRTGNIYAPFPEEMNRKLIGSLAHWHFAPTAAAAEALFAEGHHHNVFITGNTGIDALHLAKQKLHHEKRPLPTPLTAEMITKPFILITGHRRENYGEGFAHICQAITKLAKQFPHYNFIYPVHLNQHVQGPVKATLANIANVILTPPLDYPDFVNLMQHCHFLLTDSGGLQEEGPALGKPVLVMRDVTERPEGLLAGTSKLVGTAEDKIIDGVTELLTKPSVYQTMAQSVNPYGDGCAVPRILNLLAGAPAEDNTFNPLFKPIT
jgi:UDP-N-acetylglucosamine 2-epimerase (non-hydrolysing)